MTNASKKSNNDPDRLDDWQLAAKRRREADLKLTMSDRLERLVELCRQLGEIKGIAKR